MRYKLEAFNPLTGEKQDESLAPRNAGRLWAQARDRFEREPWEYHIPQGTPNWAAYGSLPARALTHMVAQPLRDVAGFAEHTRNVLHGKEAPSLSKAFGMAGLVAGGGALPLGPKGALKTGLSDEGWAELKHEISLLKNDIEGSKLEPFGQQQFMLGSGQPFNVENPAHVAAAALHHAGGDVTDAHYTLFQKHQSIASPKEKAHLANAMDWLDSAYALPKVLPLSEADLQFIESVPKGSHVDPYAALADFKHGHIKELPQVKPLTPKMFEAYEFVDTNGTPVPVYTDPVAAAQAAFHFASGDEGLAAEALKNMTQYDAEHFGDALAHLEATDPSKFPPMHTLTKSDVDYVNAVPEYSEINPWKELAKFKAGETSFLPPHVEPPPPKAIDPDLLDMYDEAESIIKEVPWKPLSKEFAAPAVLRRDIPNAVQPMNWDIMSNADKRMRAWNADSNPGLLDLPQVVRAQDSGFNVNFPLVKGLDPNKFTFVDPPWARTKANPLRGSVTAADYFENAFTDPRPQFGKPREHALFTADTPLVSNEYTHHFGGTKEEGAQNFLLYGRGDKAGQVYWPEINRGYAGYDADTMHNLTLEMLDKGYDVMGVHGINDLLNGGRGLHSQYLFARPEQLRSVFAEFDPAYREYPNLLLSQGNPFALNYLEPKDEKRTTR